MNTIIIATLRSGWHNEIKLPEEYHNTLDDVNKIYFYGAKDIEEAKSTLEAEGYYSYLPPRWDEDLDDNMRVLQDFCKMVRDLRMRAIPLTVDASDIECFTAITVSDDFYNTLQNTDFEDLKINDLNTVVEFTNMVA